jgi:hypothetical protein
MNRIESQADQVVTDFSTKKMREAYESLNESKQTNPSQEVLLKLVKDVNSWIAFLDLADTYPRFRVAIGKGKKITVEIFYP